MNRNLFLRTLTICMVLMALLTACSEKDNGPTGPGGNGDVDYGTKPDMATLAQATHNITMPTVEDLATYTSTQITYSDGNPTTAYSLEQFVPKAVTDALTNITNTTESRALFAYRMIASDGFDPWNDRQRDDLLWGDFTTGYLLPDKDFRSYFEAEEIPNTYNVKFLQTIALFRTITVVKPTGTEEVIFEIGALPTSIQPNYSGNDEPAIKLSDLITPYIIATDQHRCIFTLTAADGREEVYTWEEIQAGYFSLELDRTTFPTMPDMPGAKRGLRNLMKITPVHVEYD